MEIFPKDSLEHLREGRRTGQGEGVKKKKKQDKRKTY